MLYERCHYSVPIKSNEIIKFSEALYLDNVWTFCTKQIHHTQSTGLDAPLKVSGIVNLFQQQVDSRSKEIEFTHNVLNCNSGKSHLIDWNLVDLFGHILFYSTNVYKTLFYKCLQKAWLLWNTKTKSCAGSRKVNRFPKFHSAWIKVSEDEWNCSGAPLLAFMGSYNYWHETN